MNFSEFRKNENWLAKEDFDTPQVLTIIHADTRDMPDGKRKPCLFFKETGMVKAMGVNKTNLGTLNRLFGSDEGDDWVGQRVEVFNDPSVTFQGQVGGLRIRAAPRQVAAAIQHREVREDDIAGGGAADSSIPF